MNERVIILRGLEPRHGGRGSYQAILETAAGLFAQFPVEDTTLRDILSVSGVSNQTLYNYFPNGRDDIAIALFDRYQRTMVELFNNQISSINWNEIHDDVTIINKLSACLGRAVFGLSREFHPIQAALFEYLAKHRLLVTATHADELEEALTCALSQRLGDHLAQSELPRVARLSVRIVRQIGNTALESRDFSTDQLESNARLLVRTLLQTGLTKHVEQSGDQGLCYQEPGSTAIIGASISPTKKQGILERIMKRKGRR